MAASRNSPVPDILPETRYQPLVVFLIAVCAGILADRYLAVPFGAWLILTGAALFAWLLFWTFRLTSVSAWLLLLAALGAGGAWHHRYWHLYPGDEVGTSAGEMPAPACVEVEALTGPRWTPAPTPSPLRSIPKGDETRLLVRVLAVRDGADLRPTTGRASLTVDGHLLDVQAGDRLRVFAFVSTPLPPQNPGEFDYARYQRTEGVLTLLSADHPECVSVLGRGSWWNWRRWLGVLRSGCDALLWKHVDHRRAGLASAILLGAREQLDKELTEDFFVTGTVHILAISGMNVGILVYVFWWASRASVLSRRVTLVAASCFVVAYAMLTDAQPPVLRATILVLVICAARWSGRRALAFNSLAAGGLVVLAINPAQLFQVGTQLSFLAVSALTCCQTWLVPRASADPLDRLVQQSRPWIWRTGRQFAGSVWRLTLTGAVIWLVVLPLVWQQFCLISPAAVALSPILAIPIALALYAGFAVLVVGWLAPPLGDACGWLCDASLVSIEGCIHLARLVPGNHVWLPAPAWWWTAGCYAGFGLAAAFPEFVPRRRWVLAILVAWAALGLATSSRVADRLAGRDDQQLACTFVSVGHGTSAIIELPGGQTLLYDAGRMGSHVAGSRAIAATLWSRGISHLDAVVISHADADHYNALPELLEQFTVGVVYVSPYMFENRESPGLAELRRAIDAAGLDVRHLTSGDALQLADGTRAHVIHPRAHDEVGSDNSKSIVLRLDFAGRRILLPGDLESPGLFDVLSELPLDCDVAMAPHHGSDRSNPRGFATWSTPEYVVISGSHSRENPEVAREFERQGAAVFHTAHGGAVRVTIKRSGQLQVRSWRRDPW